MAVDLDEIELNTASSRTLALIAETRRLRAENANLRGEIDEWRDHHEALVSQLEIARATEKKDTQILSMFEIERGGHVVADGAVFPSGVCALHWRGQHASVAIYSTLDSLLIVHGHPGTELYWVARIDRDKAIIHAQNAQKDEWEGVRPFPSSNPNMFYLWSERESLLGMVRRERFEWVRK